MKTNLERIAKRGGEIYQRKLKKSLSKKKKGSFVAIEVESGDYFIAPKAIEALEKAEMAYPGKKYHLVRIGYPAAAMLKKGF